MDNSTITTDGIDAGSTRRARSAVGVKADGTVVLYEIDGNQPSYNVGLTAAELGQELKELGCVRAICLDGGGSSAMAVRNPGASTAALISQPSDGSQRACANYIFFVNNIASDGVTAHAVLTPSHRYVLPGGSTWFSVKGADASYASADAPTDLNYTVNDELGTVSGQNLHRGQQGRSRDHYRLKRRGFRLDERVHHHRCGLDRTAERRQSAQLYLGQTGPEHQRRCARVSPRSYDGRCRFLLQVERVRRCRCGKCGTAAFTAGKPDGLRHAHLLVWQRKQVHFGQCRHGRRAERSYRCGF